MPQLEALQQVEPGNSGKAARQDQDRQAQGNQHEVSKPMAPPDRQAQKSTLTGRGSAVKTVAGKILGSRGDP